MRLFVEFVLVLAFAIMLMILIFGYKYEAHPNNPNKIQMPGQGRQWVNAAHGRETHTVPTNDLIAHEWDDCACSPKIIPVETDEGAMNWQIVHYALDGRES